MGRDPESIITQIRRLVRRLWVVLLVVAIGLGYWTHHFIENRYRETLQLAQKIFVENITYDLLTGADVEVLKKCKKFAGDPAVSKIALVSLSGGQICDVRGKADAGNGETVTSEIFFDPDQREELAKVSVTYSSSFERAALRAALIVFLMLLLLPLLVTWAINRFLKKTVATSLGRLANIVSTGDLGVLSKQTSPAGLHPSPSLEISLLTDGIAKLAKAVLESREQIVESTRQSTIAKFAEQTAHDVRSPIAALKTTLATAADLSEDQRILLRSAIGRIDDIVHAMLIQSQSVIAGQITVDAAFNSAASRALETHLISGVIDSVVSEKRLQYSPLSNVEIQPDFKENSYGVFAEVDIVELKRCLSNLISNSVEALEHNRGHVEVSVSQGEKSCPRAVVEVVDNGKGIPNKLIAHLAKRGATFGKAGGTGLGLFHARTAVEAMGGSFEISSKEGQGARVKLTFPLATPPHWFVPSLNIFSTSTIVIIDDDVSIHEVWKRRLALAHWKGQLLTFLSPREFRKTLSINGMDHQHCLYFVDYEFLGMGETGLDLIEDHTLDKRSFLVTSRFEETAVRERCRHLSVRMIPKSLLALIPLSSSQQ